MHKLHFYLQIKNYLMLLSCYLDMKDLRSSCTAPPPPAPATRATGTTTLSQQQHPSAPTTLYQSYCKNYNNKYNNDINQQLCRNNNIHEHQQISTSHIVRIITIPITITTTSITLSCNNNIH